MQITVDALGSNFDATAVTSLRAREFARLDALGQVYLDYTGAGLYAESQVREHAALLACSVFGNPHSTNPASLLATEWVEHVRGAVLRFFNAPPDEYAVVFTANASAALKLVGESYCFGPRGRLLLTADNHNSVNGIREFARAAGTPITCVPLTTPDLRVDTRRLVDALDDFPAGKALFAYPAQSNLSGVQHPLEWTEYAQTRGWEVLLDAAAFVASNRLDLSRCTPEFVSLSFYKMFGYPTGIGGLIVRRTALARLRRPWFSGGTIKIVSVGADGHHLLDGEGAFEDGTVDFLGLPAIEIGLRFLSCAGLDLVHTRVQLLTIHLLQRLASLRHTNAAPLVRIYGPLSGEQRGGTIAFNVLDSSGAPLDYQYVETRANQSNISLRSGCFCNPGASEAALGLTLAELAPLFEDGARPAPQALSRRREFGAVRASLGIVTTPADIDRFVQFLECFAD
jgi:selenocysteine lyase/cysteine desulfurase